MRVTFDDFNHIYCVLYILFMFWYVDDMASKEIQILMFETLFLIVFTSSSPQTIYLRSNVEGMFTAKEIPQKTITECRDWTGIDPFNEEQMSDIYNELTYMNCVYYDLGAHEHNIYQ